MAMTVSTAPAASGHQRVSGRTWVDSPVGPDRCGRHVPRRLSPGPRAEDHRPDPPAALGDSRLGTPRSAGDGNPLRLGRRLQPQQARHGQPAQILAEWVIGRGRIAAASNKPFTALAYTQSPSSPFRTRVSRLTRPSSAHRLSSELVSGPLWSPSIVTYHWGALPLFPSCVGWKLRGV